MPETPPPNQTREIYEDVRTHPDTTVEDIVERTGWHELVVETALALMREAQMVAITNPTDPEPEPRRWALRDQARTRTPEG